MNSTTLASRLLHLGCLACMMAGCPNRLADFRLERLLGVKATAIDNQGFSLAVRCKVANPNPVDAQIFELHFESRLGQHRIGEGKLAGPLTAVANSSLELEVPLRVKYAELPADLPRRAAHKKLELTTRARFKAKTRLGTFAMDLTSTDAVALDKALEVGVAGSFSGDAIAIGRVTLAGLHLRRVRLRVRLDARNRLPFAVTVKAARYKLEINGEPFGEGELSEPLALPARGTARTEAMITATHGAVGRAIQAMLGAEPKFRVVGKLTIEPIAGISEIPIDVKAGPEVFGN